MILSRRANDDDSRDGFTKWPFMTTHTWGEYPQGTWTLEVSCSLFIIYNIYLCIKYLALSFICCHE